MAADAIAGKPAPGRPEAARASARDQILAAAKALFADRGFDGVSISDIAQGAKASKANIFHHFGSKDGLYLAIIEEVVRNAHARRATPEAGGDVVEIFTAMALSDQAEARRDEIGSRLLLREVLSDHPQRGRYLAEQVFAEDFSRQVSLIRQLQEAGRLRADVDPALAAVVLRSTAAFFLQGRSVLRHLPGVAFSDDGEEFVRQTIDVILRGLLPGGPKQGDGRADPETPAAEG